MARKASNWAKAAGDFYRKNKGKNGINSFTDVLKSSAFKTSYYAKHGKPNSRKHGGEGEMQNKTLPSITGGNAGVPNRTEDPVTVSGGEEIGGEAPESMPEITGGKRRTRGKKSSRRRTRKSRKTAKKGCMNLW